MDEDNYDGLKPSNHGTLVVKRAPIVSEPDIGPAPRVNPTERAIDVKWLRPIQLAAVKDSVEWRGQRFEVDLSKSEAWTGYQWSSGRLMLEQNPLLYPLKARGHGIDPGLYHELKNTPIIEQPLEDMHAEVTSRAFRLEPEEVPRVFANDEDHVLAQARHEALSELAWNEWTRTSTLARKTGLPFWLNDFLRATPTYGFCLHEIVTREFMWQLPGDTAPRPYWVPFLEFRAPWSVTEWIIQGGRETPVGVVLQSSFQIDSTGKVGPFQVALPASKFLHVMSRDMGRNAEGRSHLRAIWTAARKLRMNNQLEALAHEVHSLGTTYFWPGENGWDEDDEAAIVTHCLHGNASHVQWLKFSDPGTRVDKPAPSGQLADFTGPINRGERELLLGSGAESKMIGTAKEGSFAARESAEQSRRRPYGAIGRDYGALPMQELLARTIALNDPEAEAEGRMYSSRVVIDPPPVEEVEDAPIEIIDGELVPTESAQVAENIVEGEKLNGAQITAAMEAVQAVVDGLVPAVVGLELLVSVGIDRGRADAMVEAASSFRGDAEAEQAAMIEEQAKVKPSREPLKTVQEAAEIMRVSAGTIRKLAKDGRLVAAASVGNRLRFRVEDLEDLLAIGPVEEASDEPAPEDEAAPEAPAMEDEE